LVALGDHGFFPAVASRRVASVAVASRSALASAVAVSAYWLVVASVASVASRSPVGVTASIVVAMIAIVASIAASPAERTVPVASPAFA
jgi:fucose 4-O-acetylase-like acetyltransferase